ncbi:TraB/GumN family protein [Olivibacter sp. CPCC 100613]|uniref:TraB/GumN family protein n=1 Tax=Olivibacter sp. CPCC 100613 TaxID=3079931 RepID=UPI002FFB1D7A
MRLYILLIAFLSFVFVNTLKAQTSTNQATLWEISGNGLSVPSYLFGTFHLLCPEDLIFTDAIKQKLEASKQLYLELDFSDPRIGMKMMENMRMQGKTFHDLYDSLTYHQVSDSLEKMAHIRLEMLNNIKPFGLYSIVLMGALQCKPASWELQLVDLAKTKGMNIAGLETIESQASIFDTIPYKIQAEQLKEMVFNLDSTEREISTLINLYKQQDLVTLHNRTISDPLMQGYLDLLLYNRNANWIPIIEKSAKSQATFFAVGAGHLVGDKGVIDLLRKRGYTIKPLR